MIILKSAASYPLNLLAISSSGLVAATSTPRGSRIEVWETTTGNPRISPTLSNGNPCSLAFTTNGRFLLIFEAGGMSVFDVTTGTTHGSSGSLSNCPVAVLSPQDNTFLVTEQFHRAGRLSGWRIRADFNCVELWSDGWHENSWYDFPVVNSDGKLGAVIQHAGLYDPPHQTIQIRETVRGEIVRELPVERGSILGLAFTPDGTRLLEQTRGRVIRIRDVENGNLVGTLRHPGKTLITAMAVHPEGRILATCRADGKVWLWDLERLREIRSLDWKVGKLVSLAFSPDGALAAAGSDDGRVVVWDFDA